MKILLAARAKRYGCDLIDIGTHGRTEAGNMPLGWVTTKAPHVAAVPVLLVR